MTAKTSTPFIIIMARKGGVGKSTLTVLLAKVYAANGIRVLVVDMDPQATTTGVFVPDAQVDTTLLAERLTAGASLTDLVQETPISGLTILPIAEGLAICETYLDAHPMGVAKVRNSLRSLDGSGAELIIVDTPPSLDSFTFGALAAGNWAVIPTFCEHPSVQTIPSALRTVGEAQTLNPHLRVLAVVPNRLDRTTKQGLHYHRTLAAAFPQYLTKIPLPKAAAITDCMRPGCPINADAPAMASVVAVAEELLERMGSSEVPGGTEVPSVISEEILARMESEDADSGRDAPGKDGLPGGAA